MPNDKSKLLNEILWLSAHPDGLQSEERQVGHVNVNLDIDIFVISELNEEIAKHPFTDAPRRFLRESIH